MKNLFVTLVIVCSLHMIGISQVDMQPNSIGINVCNSVSELGINNVGDANTAVFIETAKVRGIYATCTTPNTGSWNYAIQGASNFAPNANFAVGVSGSSVRTSPTATGRSYGVYGDAGDATSGANYGVFGRLRGTNAGTAILGYDDIGNNGWGQVLPANVTYAGYFRGKGYFHDEVGLGEEDPRASLHVKNGNIYVENPANGIIIQSPDAACWMVTVDNAGILSAVTATCP